MAIFLIFKRLTKIVPLFNELTPNRSFLVEDSDGITTMEGSKMRQSCIFLLGHDGPHSKCDHKLS